MNPFLKSILVMAASLAEAQGESMEGDSNPKNDLIGELLIDLSHFAQYILDKAAGKNVQPPVMKSLHAA